MPYNALAPAPVNALSMFASDPTAKTLPAYSAIKNFEKYKMFTSDNDKLQADFKPLNFDRLLKAGVFRVTHQGLDDGFNPDPKAGFSLVSAYNDAISEQTRKWKDNPYALGIVRELMIQRPSDIGAHKYLQIIESARDLGLTDKDIFAPTK